MGTQQVASTELVHLLSDVLGVSVRVNEVSDFVGSASNYNSTTREMFDQLHEGFGEAVSSVAVGSVRTTRQVGEFATQYAWKTIDHIKSRHGGFKIKELNTAYVNWVQRNLKARKETYRACIDALNVYNQAVKDFKTNPVGNLPVKPELPADLSPAAYERACTGGRPRAIFDGLLGPNAQGTAAGKAKKGPSKLTDRWTWLTDRMFIRPGSNYKADIVGDVNSWSDLKNLVGIVSDVSVSQIVYQQADHQGRFL